MLTPDYLDNLPYSVIEIWQKVEDDIIEKSARAISKMGEVTGTAEIQKLVLENLGADTKEIEKAVADATYKTEQEVAKLYQEASDKVQSKYDWMGEQKNITPDKTIINQVTQAAIDSSNVEMYNLTQTMGFVKNGMVIDTTSAFRDQLSLRSLEVAVGSKSYTEATRDVIKYFAHDGLVVQYPSGVVRSLEAVVRQNIISGVSRMANEVAQQNAQMLGTDGWEISAHMASAPDHEPYQGRQYTNAEFEALDYILERPIGELNCRHFAYPVILGLSDRVYTDEQLESMALKNAEGVTYEGKHYTMYEASQKQREIERAIRSVKREMIGANAANDVNLMMDGSIRLRRLNEYYVDFSSKAGLMIQRERAQVVGYNQRLSAKINTLYKDAIAKQEAERLVKQLYDRMMKSGNGAVKTPQDAIPTPVAVKAYDALKKGAKDYSSRHEADPPLRELTEKVWDKLTDAEKRELYRYTQDPDRHNMPLRGYDGSYGRYVGPENIPKDDLEPAKAVHNAIEKASGLKDDMILYRGSGKSTLAHLLEIDVDELDMMSEAGLNARFVGGEIQDLGFMSTGIAKDAGFTNRDVNYEIYAPKGTKGIYCEPFSMFGGTNTSGTWDGVAKGAYVGGEAEFLLQNGTRFRIWEIKSDGWDYTVRMEIILDGK